MTRWFIISAVLISLPVLTDAVVDYQFSHQHSWQYLWGGEQ